VNKPCPYCGSTATQWEGDTLLCCEDCGFEEMGTYTLGPCGCVDYHMADCPILTDRYQ
jgi:hypothetical protein